MLLSLSPVGLIEAMVACLRSEAHEGVEQGCTVSAKDDRALKSESKLLSPEMLNGHKDLEFSSEDPLSNGRI